jgi:hypothetical protein
MGSQFLNQWGQHLTPIISGKLVMGHPGSVSRLIRGIPKDRELAKRLEELERMLKCED